LFERRQKCLFSQRSAGMLVWTPEFYVLFSNHLGEEGMPVGASCNREGTLLKFWKIPAWSQK